MIMASSSPDNVNPAADQCEALGVPFLANYVPWQPFYLGRGGTPDKEASALLDDLAEAATTAAGLGETISEAPSGLLGALLSLGAITSLGAGKASYDHFTRYSDEAMMREALKRRAKQQMLVRPAPVELVGPPEENA